MHKTQLTPHHIGCLTDNIKKSISTYEKMGFSAKSEIYFVSSQNVKVCFIEIRNLFYLELIEFSKENHSLNKIFKTGNPYYHIGYQVGNIQSAISELQAQGFYLVNQFSSEAFQGNLCAFLYSPEMQLIELIEK